MEIEFEGHTYQITKLGLADGKEVLAKLTEMGFFEDGLTALMRSPKEVDFLERKMFGDKLQVLNDQGAWTPMSKTVTEHHFSGKLDAYFFVMVKSIKHNFDSFLAGGWTDGLQDESEAP